MIELEHVSKVYADGHAALVDFSLKMATAQITALLGPSGCGKTTTLKLINRLLQPTSGVVRVDGADVSAVDAVQLRRRIGYVVQEGGLFPHMTARENVQIVLRLLGWEAARQANRMAELFELVGLDIAVHGQRFPSELSGGQRQRVGLARGLAADPPVLLMDEPFAALDPPTRRRLQGEFRMLQERLPRTVVLVTHDLSEAYALADHVVVMRAGRLLQEGTPKELQSGPISTEVREFLEVGL